MQKAAAAAATPLMYLLKYNYAAYINILLNRTWFLHQICSANSLARGKLFNVRWFVPLDVRLPLAGHTGPRAGPGAVTEVQRGATSTTRRRQPRAANRRRLCPTLHRTQFDGLSGQIVPLNRHIFVSYFYQWIKEAFYKVFFFYQV